MIHRQPSLGRKVALVVLTAIGAAIVLTALGIGIYEYRATEVRLRLNLDSLAQISLGQFAQLVELDYTEETAELLTRLEASRSLVGATVYSRRAGAGAKPFAQFVRSGTQLHFSDASRPDGYAVAGNRLLLVSTYRRAGRPIATLHLEGDLNVTRRDWARSLWWLAGVFALVFVIGGWLARALARTLTRPILDLAETARAVDESGDYAVRAQVSTTDEIGRLAEQFNAMLHGIDERDRRLAENASFQEAILKGSGVAVVSCWSNGLVASFNPAAEKLLGYQADEVVGRLTPTVWHDPAELQARAAELTTELGRSVSADFGIFAARPVAAGADAREWTYVCKDGTRVPVWLTVSALRGAGGELVGYVGLATDLRERKAAEAALRSFSETTAGVTGRDFFVAVVRQLCAELGVRYALIGQLSGTEPVQVRTLAAWAGGAAADLAYGLADTPCEKVAQEGLCHIPDDVAARFPRDPWLAEVSARSYAGVPIRDHTGRTVGLVAVIDDKPMPEAAAASLLLVLSATRAAAEIQRVQAAEEILTLNADLERRVGERTAELALRVGEVERLNREQQDLVENLRSSQQAADRSAARLQEVNANLLAANQELESFSYTVSHDLRAPLRNITGFIELLRKRESGRLDPESERFFTIVGGEARRMGTLIDDLLTFSRIGRTEIIIKPVPLDRLVAEVQAELEVETHDRRIEWRSAALPVVMGDPSLLRQVLANLLSNAVKFTRRRDLALIELGAHPAAAGDNVVTIFVRDNGAGFNPKYLDKLFGVFQRLHNPRDFEGTGIGLANVKRIITRHGGRVWAEGVPDKGAVFYFTLRLASPGNGAPPSRA